jgi:hypothetical protein
MYYFDAIWTARPCVGKYCDDMSLRLLKWRPKLAEQAFSETIRDDESIYKYPGCPPYKVLLRHILDRDDRPCSFIRHLRRIASR